MFIPDLQEIPDEALKIIVQILQGERGSKNQDVRLIATAGMNILERASNDSALQQLYYRLNVLPLQIPPLAGTAR